MFTFDIGFQDGSNRLFENINQVAYCNCGSITTISGNDIKEFPIPTGIDLHLSSNDQNITINGNTISYIVITKEN